MDLGRDPRSGMCGPPELGSGGARAAADISTETLGFRGRMPTLDTFQHHPTGRTHWLGQQVECGGSEGADLDALLE